MTKLVIVATHPVQYQAGWYRSLAVRSDIELTVYYAMIPSPDQQGVGFGIAFEWDVPLLEGYTWRLLPNTSRSPSLRGYFASRVPAVGAYLDQDVPDVVLLTGWQAYPLIQSLRSSRARNLPVLVRGDSNILKPRSWWKRMLHRVLLSRFDACLAVGIANREFYLQNGVPEERIFAAPHFVDNEHFSRLHESLVDHRAEIRAAWGIEESAVCFLFAGKLTPKKRVMDLLAAFDIAARQSTRELRLLIVGEGDQGEKLREHAHSLGMPAIFTGFLNQTSMPRAYTAADCLVLPSDYGETWGLVVNEAMISGKPAIVSDRVGCGPDLVVEGETGWTFPFADVNALAERFLEAARDLERLRAMGERARERVSKDYSVEAAVEGTLRALEFAANT